MIPTGFEWARRTLEASSNRSVSRYTPEVETGDYVLVHVGFALSKVNEEEAERTYKLLEEMDQLTELEVADVEEESHEVPRRVS